MAEHPDVAIVRNAYESFAKGDLDGALADMADDCVFHFGGDGPNSGDHKGREAIAAALINNFELTGGVWALDIKGIFANDEHAAVVLHETAAVPMGRRSSWTRCTSSAFVTARCSTCGTCPRTSRRTTTSSTGSSRQRSGDSSTSRTAASHAVPAKNCGFVFVYSRTAFVNAKSLKSSRDIRPSSTCS